jgi:phage shock protein C
MIGAASLTVQAGYRSERPCRILDSGPGNGGVPMATLVRPRQGKIIAGVCAGLAMRFGISVTLIRVAFVVFAVTGVGELVYLILWVVMPKAPE